MSTIHPRMIFVTACMVMGLGITGCQDESASDPDGSPSGAEVVALEEYDIIVSYEEGILANPAAIKYDGDSLLYVYDAEKKQVLVLDENGEIAHEFGGEGRGPGEVLWFNNIYLNDNYFYVVDPVQFRIIRFTLDGGVDGSLDYGRESSQSQPPPAPQSLIPRAKNITNKPFVTTSGNILLPAVQPNIDAKNLYTLVDWEGKELAEIGDIPKGSAFVLDGEQYREAVSNRGVPAYYKPKVFPVNDYSNNDKLYFIYTALPKIMKYSTSGKKLWERDVPKATELDSVYTHFYEESEQLLGRGGRTDLNTYVSGISSGEGRLYLILQVETSNDLWIHEFTNNGELSRRFRLVSEDVNLAAIFDIDFTDQRIFMITEEAEIRAYPF